MEEDRSRQESLCIWCNIIRTTPFRVKCRKCKSTITSLTSNDVQTCSCHSISISGGNNTIDRKLIGDIKFVDYPDAYQSESTNGKRKRL